MAGLDRIDATCVDCAFMHRDRESGWWCRSPQLLNFCGHPLRCVWERDAVNASARAKLYDGRIDAPVVGSDVRPPATDSLLFDADAEQEQVIADIAAAPVSSTPVVMLTAKGDPMDRVVGLELGADDYIPKPFEPRELLARIRAVLRRRPAVHLRRCTRVR